MDGAATLRTCGIVDLETVSVAADLTREQRREEADLVKEAEKRNEERNEEDKSKNLQWLVVGRKGEKRLLKGVDRGRGGHLTGANAMARGQPTGRRNASRLNYQRTLPIRATYQPAWGPASSAVRGRPVHRQQKRPRMQQENQSEESEEREEEEEQEVAQ